MRPRHWAPCHRLGGSSELPPKSPISLRLTIQVECHQQVVESIPTAWPLVLIPRAVHGKEVDEPQLVVEAVAKFLHTCEMTRGIAPF